jgi:UDP-N-acetylglucosamine 2-epimerase (non-hydrolysing)
MSGPESIRPPVTLRVVPGPSEPDEERRSPVVVHVLSGRADAVRLAPVVAALAVHGAFRQVVVHVGAPEDLALVASVEDDLRLPAAAHVVRAAAASAGASAAELTATTLTGFDDVLRGVRPDLVVLSGDTNPTLACALASAKRGVAVAHLESGLRSLDWTTPEEINRVVIDRLADTLLAPGRDAAGNLLAEGVPEGRVHAVGSTATDALRTADARAR